MECVRFADALLLLKEKKEDENREIAYNVLMLVLAFSLAVSFVSCGNTGDENGDEINNEGEAGDENQDEVGDEGEDKSPYSEGIEFKLNDDENSYSVVGIGSCQDTHIVTSETYNGLNVTSIGEEAFYS